MPAKLGPARRHYHILAQLNRFFDVYLLSLGKASEEEAFAREFRHRVAGFTYANRADIGRAKVVRKLFRTFTARCDFLPVLEPELRRCCAELTGRETYSAIVLSTVLLRGLPLPDGVPIVGDTHNVEFDVLRRTAAAADDVLLRRYAARQWRAMRQEEQRCAVGVNLLLATSNRDRDLFERELGIADVAVIPNGIDLQEFSPASDPPRGHTIVFSGLMSYYPNQQAARWFIHEVFPRIRRVIRPARLIVAGAAPPRWLTDLNDRHVEVTGRVDDIRPYLIRASVVVAPLRIGGGTRVKILEALALGRPVVSTTLGAEGLGLQDGESILLGDDAPSFAARVVEVLSDPGLAAHLGRGGRQHVVANFDWERIGDRLAGVLHERLGLSPQLSENQASTQPEGVA